jgi:hypothetical protein
MAHCRALALWPILSKLLQMSTIDSANPPQEYPDIVGARPTNPLAANFKSFIPASAHLPELTWPHLITGTILGIIFGASSLYLVLKVGLTVSASIPVAVISITIFALHRSFFGRATQQSCKTTSFKPQGRRASRSRSAWV